MTDLRARVAHVTTAHPPTDNRIIRKECTSLVEAGFDVHLIAVAERDHTAAGVRIKALPPRGSRLRRMLLGPIAAWCALKHLRPDLVHVHDPELIPLAVLWRRCYGTSAVYDAHEDLPKQVMGKPYLPRGIRPIVASLAKLLETTADRFLDGIVAATPSIARNYRRAPVTLVQNFPWLRDFPPAREPDDPPSRTAVYVGGIAESRGAMEMVEAVRSSSLNAKLVLAGPVASSGLLRRIKDASDVATYLGRLPAEEIPAVIADAAVGLIVFHPLPNNVESQPTKLFEYMAAGRPFIASDFPAWRHLLEAFRCGVFVEPKDINGLRSAIDSLLADPHLSRRMGERGREAFLEHFCFERQAEHLVRMTHRLIASASSGPITDASSGRDAARRPRRNR